MFLKGKFKFKKSAVLRRIILLHIIILLLVNIVQAKKYYFSSSTGNDSYTSTQAQNSATPWRTISKLNSFFSSLSAGDSILLKRGDVFYGCIVVNKSGTSTLPIVISDYGSGNKPIISGFTKLTSWSSSGNGIYQVSIPNAKSSLNLVTLNNTPQAMGRYPNADAANGGYLTYESFTGTTSITDKELPATPNWTGAEAVIRKKLWVIDRCKITNHTGTTLTYTDPSGYDGNNNYGYFIQDDPRTLDKFGEWYLNKSTKVLQMYFGTATPSSYNIQAGTIDTLLIINTKDYITINNLGFEGANGAAIYNINSRFIKVQNCDINNAGETGIYTSGAKNLLLENNSTYNILSSAFFVTGSNSDDVIIRGCTVKRTGCLVGMGLDNGNSYKGVVVKINSNLLIEYNRVDTSGYVGIEFQGSNVLVKNNVVNYFCYVKDNGGGIYTWSSGTDADPGPVFTNRVVKDNIVMYAVGAPAGRTSTSLYDDGIFLDGQSMNVEVSGNTVFNNGRSGINSNNPANINITGNTSFNNGNAISVMQWSWGSITNLNITKNILYPKNNAQRNVNYNNQTLAQADSNSAKQVLKALGLVDGNYYSTSNAAGFNADLQTLDGTKYPTSSQSLEGWKIFSGQDTNSKKPLREAPAYLLNKIIGSNLVSNSFYNSTISGVTVFGTNTSAIWDNTGKISGGALKIIFSSPEADKYVKLYSSVGPCSATKKYIFRFTTLGTTAFGIARAYLRKTASPYNSLTPVEMRSFGTAAKVHEFLFAAPITDADASFVIEIEQNSGTTYIDNVELYEADATVYNQDEYLRFEYNATTTDKVVSLAGNYIDPEGKYYAGSITLQPFTSKILVKDTSVIRQALALQSSNTAINCFGDSSTVTISATGGIAPYTGTGIFKVAAGTYTFTVNDLTGTGVSKTITVSQPASALKVTATAGTITSVGGTTSVTINATGGTSPYTGTGVFNNVIAGTYTYTVKDAKGCSASVTVTITQPTTISASATAPVINCYGSTADVTVSAAGGTSPYTGTGTYAVSAGRGVFKLSFPAVVAGTYTSLYYTIGAVSSAKKYVLRFSTLGTTTAGNLRASIRQTISPWTVLTAKQTANYGTARTDHEFIFTPTTNQSAASFYIEINQNSGTTYIDNMAFFEVDQNNKLVGSNLISNSDFETSINNVFVYSSNNNHTVSWDTTGKINSTYYFTVKDAKNISSTAVVNTSQPSLLQVSAVPGTISVYGGSTSVIVAATGGTAPYTGTGTISNVIAGTHTYTVTDTKGCTGNVTITIDQPLPALKAVNSTAAISCFGNSTAATVTATGGKSPYTGAGTYNVNAGKAALKLSFPVVSSNSVTLLYYTIGAVDPLKKYILKFTTLGTTTTGSFRVSLRQTSSPFTGITAKQNGTFSNIRKDHEYTFTPTQSKMAASFLIEVFQNSGTTYIDNISFFEATEDSVIRGKNLYTTGNFESGIGNILIYSSDNNHVSSLDTSSKIGNSYYYVITDAAGASVTSEIKTTQPSAPLQITVNAGTITTSGGTTTVTVSASGGTAPYTGIGSFTGIRTGTYTYKVTDAKGCTISKTITINQTAARSATTVSGARSTEVIEPAKSLNVTAYPNPSASAFDLVVNGGNNEKVGITIMGVNGNVVYKTTGNSNQHYLVGQNLATGIYMVQVMQANIVKTLKLIKVK